jgi:hypothetical protein
MLNLLCPPQAERAVHKCTCGTVPDVVVPTHTGNLRFLESLLLQGAVPSSLCVGPQCWCACTRKPFHATVGGEIQKARLNAVRLPSRLMLMDWLDRHGQLLYDWLFLGQPCCAGSVERVLRTFKRSSSSAEVYSSSALSRHMLFARQARECQGVLLGHGSLVVPTQLISVGPGRASGRPPDSTRNVAGMPPII